MSQIESDTYLDGQSICIMKDIAGHSLDAVRIHVAKMLRNMYKMLKNHLFILRYANHVKFLYVPHAGGGCNNTTERRFHMTEEQFL